jgi:hypothetical protein
MGATAIQGTNANLSTGISLTGVGAGHFLALADFANGTTAVISSITDTVGNTWTKALQISPFNSTHELWYAANTIAGLTTLTINWSAAPGAGVALCFEEYSGVITSNPLETVVGNTSSGTAVNSGATGNTTAGDLVIGILGANSGWPPTPGGSFVNRQTFTSNFATCCDMMDIVNGSGGPQTATATIGSTSWGCICAAFLTTFVPYDAPIPTNPITSSWTQ